MAIIVLISCASKKENYPCVAKQLYSKSPIFRLSYEYAEMIADQIYVLSAKHGLLDKNQMVSPYDETLLEKTNKQIKKWSEAVIEELKDKVSLEEDKFIILAGKSYYKYLISSIANYTLPLEHITQGKRINALKELIEYKEGVNLSKEIHI